MRPLHPNLARIAAEYDEIVSLFQRGQMTATQANAKIRALVARDDAGLEWSIDTNTGSWQFRTTTGDLVISDPPTWGLAGATPRDFGSLHGKDPDQRVDFHEVDESRFAGSLHGSTRRMGSPDREQRQRPKAILGLGVLLVTVLAFAAFLR